MLIPAIQVSSCALPPLHYKKFLICFLHCFYCDCGNFKNFTELYTVLFQSIIVFQACDVKDSIDKTWIVSAQSPVQRELLDAHPRDISVFVEGAFRIWLRKASVGYFILRADPRPKPTLPLRDLDGMFSTIHI